MGLTRLAAKSSIMFDAFVVARREGAERLSIVASLRELLIRSGSPVLVTWMVRGLALGLAFASMAAIASNGFLTDGRMNAAVTLVLGSAVALVAGRIVAPAGRRPRWDSIAILESTLLAWVPDGASAPLFRQPACSSDHRDGVASSGSSEARLRPLNIAATRFSRCRQLTKATPARCRAINPTSVHALAT